MKIGQIVYSQKGRDSGKYYIVVDIIDKYVFICDGKQRLIECPKKKNISHLKGTDEFVIGIKEQLKNNKLTNSSISKILKNYYSNESISYRKEE